MFKEDENPPVRKPEAKHIKNHLSENSKTENMNSHHQKQTLYERYGSKFSYREGMDRFTEEARKASEKIYRDGNGKIDPENAIRMGISETMDRFGDIFRKEYDAVKGPWIDTDISHALREMQIKIFEIFNKSDQYVIRKDWRDRYRRTKK